MTIDGLLSPRSRALATLLVVLTACGGKTDSNGAGSASAPVAATSGTGTGSQSKLKPGTGEPGLEMDLSNGKQGASAVDHTKLAPAKRLSDAEAEALLARGKPIAADAADPQAFALRDKSKPPPRTGQTITSTFPPPASSLAPPPAATDAGPLRVVRYMPEGKVPIAPQVSVTFSQPMVAVTSQDDAAATTPVQLTPPAAGKWRWIGTRTILFDPFARMPQATTFHVTIPAGTKSATGGTLAKATEFTFETPPPRMVSHSPDGGPQKLDAAMFVLFDQKIDPQAVLDKLVVTGNGQAQKLRLLTAQDLAADKSLKALVDGAKKDEQDGRWIAFRAVSDLPVDAQIEVKIPPGTKSAEGPNPTTEPQSFAFRTYPPLKLEEARCGWNEHCAPSMPLVIRFNNPLSDDKFDESLVTVTPAIPGLQIQQAGQAITLFGATKARTTYQVTIAERLIDGFGQALGKPQRVPWAVGDAVPTFFGPEGLVVLDPSAKQPTLDFFSMHCDQLKVELYAVTPADFDAYAAAMRRRWDHDKPMRMPGRKVLDRVVKIAGDPNALAETHVDLKPALAASGLGHVIAIVTPPAVSPESALQPHIAWVQATRLGIDAHVDNEHLIAYASDLATGVHAAGVQLEIRPYGVTGTTDDRGVTTLDLAPRAAQATNFLVARKGDDVAFVLESDMYMWSEGGTWVRQPRNKNVVWYVTDDRRLYKPGEEVSIKAWLRTIDQGMGGDIGGLAGAVTAVNYRVVDSRGNEITKGNLPVSAVGGFDLKFSLPKTPNLGSAQIYFDTQGTIASSFSHVVEVEEFRRPEFEVSAQASQGPFVVGGGGDVTVNAKYFAGGPLAGADAAWQVTAAPTSFTPPNHDGYTFGEWTPWWGGTIGGDFEGGFEGGFRRGGVRYRPPKTWTFRGKTDATGAHTLHMDYLAVNPARPMSVTATAQVIDVNRQAWSASSTLIVHPSSRYVGLKAKRPFVDKGTPFALDVIGVDVDGKPVPGAKIEVTAERVEWKLQKGRMQRVAVDPQTCHVTATAEPVACTFATQTGGEYEVTATIVDDQARANQSQLTFWVSGGDAPPAREVRQEQVQLIPDQKTYAPGTTADLLVRAPFYPAEGLVSWRRSGIVKTEPIKLDAATTVIHVPIADTMVPNLTVQVDLVGSAPRTNDHGDPDPSLPRRPAYAVGAIELSIPPTQRTLAVTVTPAQATLAPGDKTQLALAVNDASGRPVAGAEATVIVVDEAILALTGAQFANPIDTFYLNRPTDSRDAYSQAYVKLTRPDASALTANGRAAGGTGAVMADSAPGEPPPPPPAPPMAAMAAPAAPSPAAEKQLMMKPGLVEGGGGLTKHRARGGLDDEASKFAAGSGAGEQAKAVAIRSDFNPLAAWAPAVHTDAAGKATVELKLPDNLTRYRVVAIAVAGDKQFGKGESAVTARMPLMVRPSPPRFLNFGDTFQLPVVVQNQTDHAMTVRVAVRASNAALTEGAGRELSVPANDRVEVQFPAAAEMAGTARFQIVGVAGGSGAAGAMSDAAELALPVWTPATTEAFATYGVIDDGVVQQPIALPGKVVTQFGGIDVTTASTNLQALTDAVLYLVHYPFECAEQRSSRILSIAALKDELAAFHAKDMPSASAMAGSVSSDVERLIQMQNGDGGFAFWDRGHPSEPYLSVFVASALGHARDKGFTVPLETVQRAVFYLRNIEAHYPAYYPQEVRWAISAYALATRKQLGDLDLAKAKALFAQAGIARLPIEASGWLLATLAQNPGAAAERQAIVRNLLNKVSETAGAANFTTSYGDGTYLLLASDRRVDAVLLDALIQEQPSLDLIPKIVTGLLAHRKAGRWLNTQENTFALVALDRYFQTYEKATPDFVARVWLGDDYAGDHAFHGRSTDSYDVHIAMADVASHDKSALTIQKDGAGRLYYRIGMTYAPASLQLAQADHGFVVERRYEGVDDPKDVTQANDGVWHIKAGARVRVRLTMVNDNRRYHVALVDPLPAGLEAMNPALATTGPIPQDPSEQKTRGAYWWWIGPWYEHQNLRDERVEAFASLLWEGVHTYDYVARATTPGRFIVPPTHAEEMYMPETFGRGTSDRVVVE